MSSYQITNTTVYDKLRKAAVTGGIAAAASGVFFGQTGSTNLFGVSMPVMAAIGLSSAASSVTADYAHETVFPLLPGLDKYAKPEAAALGVAVSGGASAFILNEGDILNTSAMNAFLLGAGSYAAGDWIDSRFLSGNSGSGGALGYF